VTIRDRYSGRTTPRGLPGDGPRGRRRRHPDRRAGDAILPSRSPPTLTRGPPVPIHHPRRGDPAIRLPARQSVYSEYHFTDAYWPGIPARSTSSGDPHVSGERDAGRDPAAPVNLSDVRMRSQATDSSTELSETRHRLAWPGSTHGCIAALTARSLHVRPLAQRPPLAPPTEADLRSPAHRAPCPRVIRSPSAWPDAGDAGDRNRRDPIHTAGGGGGTSGRPSS
jgi:hypothetical protein